MSRSNRSGGDWAVSAARARAAASHSPAEQASSVAALTDPIFMATPRDLHAILGTNAVARPRHFFGF